MSRLISSQLSKHEGKRFMCYRCMNTFHSQESLDNHVEYCNDHDVVKIEMPKPKIAISFSHYKKKLRAPL